MYRRNPGRKTDHFLHGVVDWLGGYFFRNCGSVHYKVPFQGNATQIFFILRSCSFTKTRARYHPPQHGPYRHAARHVLLRDGTRGGVLRVSSIKGWVRPGWVPWPTSTALRVAEHRTIAADSHPRTMALTACSLCLATLCVLTPAAVAAATTLIRCADASCAGHAQVARG